MPQRFLALACAVAILAGFPPAARAVVAVHGNAQNVPYVMAFAPLNSNAHPYAGTMHLTFNNGIISGTYTDISIKPGSPFANAHNISVQGNISTSHVTLIIRNTTFRGSMSADKMSGSATIRGIIYEFAAHPGSPGSGK